MTDLWVPSTAYTLGALVLPRASATVVQEDLTNAGFESGDSGWTKGAGWTISSGGAYAGTWKAARSNIAGTSLLVNGNVAPVVPGQSLTATAAILTLLGATARIGIKWLDAGSALISTDYGTLQDTSAVAYKLNTVTAVAPPLAAFAVLQVEGTCTGAVGEAIGVDAATWDYAYVEIPPALFFEATVAGTSGTGEPTWPTVVAGTVVDGGVTWTARAAVSITWKAVPILKTGAVEPTWATDQLGLTADGTISWQAVSRRIEDAKCPNTKVVVKAASKIWAVGEDEGEIVRFCAVNNCKDWQSPEDAGYLPTGTHQDGNNRTLVLGIYRGNLVPFSSSTFQMWGIDEDPAANALIDKMEGIGSRHHRAARSVGNEYYFLTAQGVRTVGIAAGSTNLQAGDIGMPIDTLIQERLAWAEASNVIPLGMYFPAAGQYWLAIYDQVFVYTMNKLGAVGAWSRYVFPFVIKDYALLGDELYLLDSARNVHLITQSVNYDEMVGDEGVEQIYFDGVIQWPHLDCGAPGADKTMHGFDLVGTGEPTVQFGYNQNDPTALTTAYVIDEDTLTGGIIAMPLTAPSFSVKITYVGAEGNEWQLNAVNLYFL